VKTFKPFVHFYFNLSDDKDQKKSQKILAELENIDDECDQHDIAFVKIDNDKEAKEYGIDTIPTLVFFEKGIPHIFEGESMLNAQRSVFLILFPKKIFVEICEWEFGNFNFLVGLETITSAK
jgi:Thioredoxin.